MFLSIITINFNNASGLETTIDSVFQQKFVDFEYIIIDGGSVDSSVDIITKYQSRLKYWVSEKDNGVYHAMNKGITKATGEYLLFLNSGDFLYNDTVLQYIFTEYSFDKDIIYGNLYLETGKTLVEKVYPGSLTFKYFYFLNESLPHPSTFIRKTLLEKAGLFNEHLQIVSDWEFWLKSIFLMQATYMHINVPVSVFNLEGISSKPGSEKINRTERDQVYQKYFSWIVNDYKEYERIDNHINSNLFIRILKKLRLYRHVD